jgi:hypothetical protein
VPPGEPVLLLRVFDPRDLEFRRIPKLGKEIEMMKSSLGHRSALSDRELRQRQQRERQMEFDAARAASAPRAKHEVIRLLPEVDIPAAFVPNPVRSRPVEIKRPLPAAPQQVKPPHVIYKKPKSRAGYDQIRARVRSRSNLAWAGAASTHDWGYYYGATKRW